MIIKALLPAIVAFVSIPGMIRAQEQTPDNDEAFHAIRRLPDHNIASGPGEQYRVRQGDVLDCVNELRVNDIVQGHVNCLVSRNNYAVDSEIVLIPQGSRAIGTVTKVIYSKTDPTVPERLLVSFHTLIEPDGYTVILKDADGIDRIGQLGFKLNRHHYVPEAEPVAVYLGDDLWLPSYKDHTMEPHR